MSPERALVRGEALRLPPERLQPDNVRKALSEAETPASATHVLAEITPEWRESVETDLRESRTRCLEALAEIGRHYAAVPEAHALLAWFGRTDFPDAPYISPPGGAAERVAEASQVMRAAIESLPPIQPFQ